MITNHPGGQKTVTEAQAHHALACLELLNERHAAIMASPCRLAEYRLMTRGPEPQDYCTEQGRPGSLASPADQFRRRLAACAHRDLPFAARDPGAGVVGVKRVSQNLAPRPPTRCRSAPCARYRGHGPILHSRTTVSMLSEAFCDTP